MSHPPGASNDACAGTTTAGCDLLLPVEAPPLLAALSTLRRLGYSIEAGDEPLPGDDPVAIDGGIVRARATVRGRPFDTALRAP